MARYTVEDKPDLTLPVDSIHRARLMEVQERDIHWTDRDGNRKERTLLAWWWQITATRAGEQYIGRKVKGECPAELNNRDDNLFRTWAEALLQRHLDIGAGLDPDDLIGLEAEIVIGHEPDKQNPLKRWERVTHVHPITGGGHPEEPPF